MAAVISTEMSLRKKWISTPTTSTRLRKIHFFLYMVFNLVCTLHSVVTGYFVYTRRFYYCANALANQCLESGSQCKYNYMFFHEL